jgi:hypothetical protein
MQYALNILEDIIINKFIISCSNNSFSPEKFEQWYVIAIREIEKIKKDFTITAFNSLKKRHLKCYVQYQQSRIISLYDKSYNFLNDSHAPVPADIKSAEENIFSLFDDLLLFIQIRFPEYFDFSLSVPVKQKLETCTRCSEASTDLKLKLSFVDPRLLNIILNSIQNVVKDSNNLNFQQISYFNRLIKLLYKISDNKIEQTGEWHIVKSLIYVNFNSIQAFNYIIDKINAKIEVEDSTSVCIKKLSWFLKSVKQVIILQRISLHPEQETLKSLLSQWLSEEILFYEKQVQLNSHKPNPGLDTNSDFKIMTDWSVPQFAFYLRMLVDIGLLKNQNITKLASFYANHLKTSQTEEVSEKKLRISYYENKESVLQEVKAAIIKMLNYINSRSSIVLLLVPIFNDSF